MSLDHLPLKDYEHDPWVEAKKYWDGVALSNEETAKGLRALEQYRETCVRPEQGNKPANILVAMAGSREAAEHAVYPWDPARKMWGVLPYFEKRNEIVSHFSEEAAYFGKHYTTGKGPEWRDPSYAGGALLFELKFGKRLSHYAEEILAHYPKLGTSKGKEMSVFGLSGSGKSTAVEALKEQSKEHVVVIDSDTVRYNLLAKMIRDVERARGTPLQEVRDHIMHNDISGTLYLLLHYVTKELKDRGYTVLKSSTFPTEDADVIIYIEHPDGIDPRTITSTQIPDVAKALFVRTQARLPTKDNYDWDHAETITDFNAMRSVAVQVPERVHASFIKNIREVLAGNSTIRVLANPKIEDVGERKASLAKRLKQIMR